MDTFFTRLFTVILSYLHSHRLNPKRKGKKINKIRFKLLIKSRIEKKRKKGIRVENLFFFDSFF